MERLILILSTILILSSCSTKNYRSALSCVPDMPAAQVTILDGESTLGQCFEVVQIRAAEVRERGKIIEGIRQCLEDRE